MNSSTFYSLDIIAKVWISKNLILDPRWFAVSCSSGSTCGSCGCACSTFGCKPIRKYCYSYQSSRAQSSSCVYLQSYTATAVLYVVPFVTFALVFVIVVLSYSDVIRFRNFPQFYVYCSNLFKQCEYRRVWICICVDDFPSWGGHNDGSVYWNTEVIVWRLLDIRDIHTFAWCGTLARKDLICECIAALG